MAAREGAGLTVCFASYWYRPDPSQCINMTSYGKLQDRIFQVGGQTVKERD